VPADIRTKAHSIELIHFFLDPKSMLLHDLDAWCRGHPGQP